MNVSLFVALQVLLLSFNNFAQTNCVPVLKFRSGYNEMPATVHHEKLPPLIGVEVQSDSTCTHGVTYEIFRGSAYIVKNNQLAEELPIQNAAVQITRWQYQLKPGDRISFKVTHIVAKNAKGEKKPIVKTLYGYIAIN